MSCNIKFKTFICSESFGVVLVDEEKHERVRLAFADVLAGIIGESGKSSRKLKVQLAFRICKSVGLGSSRGDVAVLSNVVGISFNFTKRIVHSALNGGSEEDLFEKRRPKTAFANTEWVKKLRDFAFQPENARSVPGAKKKQIVNHY